MKKILMTALALFAFGFANAQDDEGGFKAGIHVGLPMGDAGDFYNLNVGVDLAYMFPVAEGFVAGVTTGYSYYSGKEFDYGFGAEKFNGAFIPVAATAQYSLSETFFLGLDLGYALYVGDGEGDGGLYYQPKVGYQMEKIEVYLGYKGIAVEETSISSVNIGAAYKF